MTENKSLINIALSVVIFICFSCASSAETIYLKSGEKIEGKIIERTDEYIKVDVGDGMPTYYFLAGIERIGEEVPLSTSVDKEGSLVIVGDATLTYASYFFLLPANWIPLMANMDLTHKTGYWHGRHKNTQTLMEIQPIKKPKEETLASIVNFTKEYSQKESLSDSWQKYLYFKPIIDYAYEAYTFNNSKKGTYELFVFIEIPSEYVITFILTGEGKDENCIAPYFEDFKKVITSFRWILGLSDEEIGKMLSESKQKTTEKEIMPKKADTSESFSGTVYLKSGSKIKGVIKVQTPTDTFLEINDGKKLHVLPNNEIERIERDKAIISLEAESNTTYINEDIGLKIIGPLGWHMYSAEKLAKADDLTREAAGKLSEKVGFSDYPFRTKVIEFTKYPFGQVYPNAIISLDLIDMSMAPEELMAPVEYLNYLITESQKVVKDFKILEEPQKIIVNNQEGAKVKVQYEIPVYGRNERFKQIIYVFFNGSFVIKINVTNSYDNFEQDRDDIEKCIQSLFLSDMSITPGESELYRIAGGGFIFKKEKNKATYFLMLKPKKDIKDLYYVEAEYENPDNLQQPILTSSEAKLLPKLSEREDIITFESPELNHLRPFKAYVVKIKTYESKEKKLLIDTFKQKILSVLYF